MNFICPNVYETDIKRINDEHWFYFSFFTLIFKVLIFYIKKKQSVRIACICIGLHFAYFLLNKRKSFFRDLKDN